MCVKVFRRHFIPTENGGANGANIMVPPPPESTDVNQDVTQPDV